MYDSLISILREEIKVYRALHDSLVDERKMLAGASVDDLYASNTAKENCILKAGMLEDGRLRLMRKIAAGVGLNRRRMTLSTLLPYGDNTQQDELNDCRAALRSLLTEIQAKNETNKLLLEDSLSCVKKSVDFLGQLIYPGATYLNTGQLKGNTFHGRLVSREG